MVLTSGDGKKDRVIDGVMEMIEGYRETFHPTYPTYIYYE
jgi:hypothetical protein